MNKKEQIFKNQNQNSSNEQINIIDLKKLPDPDDFMNDSDSEENSQYYENLKNQNISNNVSNKADSRLINEKINNDKTELQEKSFNFLIDKNDIQIEIEKDILLPRQYFYDKIKNEIFPKLNLKNELKKNFIKNDIIINLENNMSDEHFLNKKTRNRGQKKSKEKNYKKKGRKKIDDNSAGIHNKDSPDNIIKKIKSKLLDYHLLNFINSLLNTLLNRDKINVFLKKNINEKEQEKEKLIKKIDYKQFVDDMKRENNLNFLKLSLKGLLSKDISKKYSTLPKDLNKTVINEILNKEKDNEIISFLFNLTFGEWFDVFTFKKEITDLKFLDYNEKLTIMNKFERIDKLLEDIYLNNDINYYSSFVYLIYNYERWFYVKQGRKRGKKKDKNKDEK